MSRRRLFFTWETIKTSNKECKLFLWKMSGLLLSMHIWVQNGMKLFLNSYFMHCILRKDFTPLWYPLLSIFEDKTSKKNLVCKLWSNLPFWFKHLTCSWHKKRNYEFKVLHKGQRAFQNPFSMVFYLLFSTLKTFSALLFHFKRHFAAL